MAGRARSNAISDALTTRAADYAEGEADDTLTLSQLDYVACWVAEGKTVKALALELTNALHFEVWAETLMRHLKRTFGEAAVDTALDAARVRASHSLAEEALDIVDAPAETQIDVSRASSRARSRQWMAERLNPSKYGQSKGVNVSISVGALHLDALRAASAKVTVTSPAQLTDGNSQPVTLPESV